MNKNTDYLNIQEWAKKRYEELKQDIKLLIDSDVNTEKAIDIILGESTIGKTWKDKIRQEFS